MAKKTKELDKETAKIEAVGTIIKDLVGSSGWAEARKRLFRKVAELQMITNVEIQNADATALVQIIAANTRAARILLEWLRDIEGSAEQHDGNAEILVQEVESIVMEVQ
jgi:hypothetical protein